MCHQKSSHSISQIPQWNRTPPYPTMFYHFLSKLKLYFRKTKTCFMSKTQKKQRCVFLMVRLLYPHQNDQSSHLVRRLRKLCHIPMGSLWLNHQQKWLSKSPCLVVNHPILAGPQVWLGKSQLLLVRESLLLAKSPCEPLKNHCLL